MIKNAFHVAVRNPSSLVFVAVVASGFVMTIVRAKPVLADSEIFGLAEVEREGDCP